MSNDKKKNYKHVIIWALIILLSPVIYRVIRENIGRPDIETISTKIEKYLYEKYGEEFAVDRIGLRSSRGQEFYQARIYPRSIIGTNKQWDDYYYGEASLDKKSFGRLGGVGDGYGKVMMNISAEEHLMPKAKEIFGERVLIKTDIKYKKREESGYFVQYLEENFKEQLEKVNNDPENNRLEIDLQIYIFDRINNEAEKEMRRKQIFDFVQYLKKEGLYEYLEMGVIFIDERVLAPGYNKFRREIERSTKVREKVDGEEVYLPPRVLRKEMSEQLQKEIDKMSEEELLENMKELRKSDLSYEGIREYNGQYQSWIYSIGMLEQKYKSSITEEDRNRKHNKVDDIDMDIYRKYIY